MVTPHAEHTRVEILKGRVEVVSGSSDIAHLGFDEYLCVFLRRLRHRLYSTARIGLARYCEDTTRPV